MGILLQPGSQAPHVVLVWACQSDDGTSTIDFAVTYATFFLLDQCYSFHLVYQV